MSDLNVDEFLKDNSDENKLIINEFLNWEDSEKDRFVYNAISCGFEYCSLSSRKNIPDIDQIFDNKVFYLDANIIFRLMGLNNIERQSVIEAFVDKCDASGIKLVYTNFTQKEIESTIRYHVKKISGYYGTASAIRGEYVRILCPKYANVDFLTAYHDWSVSKGNRYGDYAGFSRFLLHKAESVLGKFELIKIATHKSGEKQDSFDKLVKELSLFKQQHGKYTYQDSIETDVDNYMTVLMKCDDAAKDVTNTNHYIISADHPYVSWARERIPGVVPIIILPSVWYSLLLKFRGRSENDFRAFSQFMNQRLSWDAEDDPRIDKLLRHILSMRENQDIKEAIALEVSQNLKGRYKDYENESEIIDNAKEYVLTKKIEDVRVELEAGNLQEHQKLKQKYQETFVEETEKISVKAKAEGRIEGVELGEKVGFDKGKETGLSEGANNREKELYDELCKIAPQKVRLRLWIMRFLYVSYVLFVLLLICGWAYCRFVLPETAELHKLAQGIAPNAVTLISFLCFMSGCAGWKYIKNNVSCEKLSEKYIQKRCDELKINKFDFDR